MWSFIGDSENELKKILKTEKKNNEKMNLKLGRNE